MCAGNIAQESTRLASLLYCSISHTIHSKSEYCLTVLLSYSLISQHIALRTHTHTQAHHRHTQRYIWLTTSTVRSSARQPNQTDMGRNLPLCSQSSAAQLLKTLTQINFPSAHWPGIYRDTEASRQLRTTLGNPYKDTQLPRPRAPGLTSPGRIADCQATDQNTPPDYPLSWL